MPSYCELFGLGQRPAKDSGPGSWGRGAWGMRHFFVGAFLVLAALTFTAVTATLLERAALNRQEAVPATAVVERPLPAKAKPGGELARQVILVSRRLAHFKD